MKLGFVGVGQMGAGMAINLLKAGHELTIYSRRESAPVEEVIKQGAEKAQTLPLLAEAVDVVVLCLTGTKAAQEVAVGLLPGLSSGKLVIDTTTNEADGPQALAAMLGEHGVTYVEAPLTGGVKQAREGVLGAIVGSDTEEAFYAARPILEGFCERVEHFGPLGMGARTKLVSNFLALGTATLVVETFRQARELGIDWRKLYELAQLGSGNSSGLQRIMGNAVDGNYSGYVFSIDNCLKDLTYICEMGEHTGTLPSLAPVMREIYAQASNAGLGSDMISQLLEPDE